MGDVNRWDYDYSAHGFAENPAGDLVLFSDHEREVAVRDARIAELENGAPNKVSAIKADVYDQVCRLLKLGPCESNRDRVLVQVGFLAEARDHAYATRAEAIARASHVPGLTAALDEAHCELRRLRSVVCADDAASIDVVLSQSAEPGIAYLRELAEGRNAAVEQLHKQTALAGRLRAEKAAIGFELADMKSLLARIVTYAREDSAHTPGFTRLARALEEAEKLLGGES